MKRWLLQIAFVLALAFDHWLGNTPRHVFLADPISISLSGILISMAISAAMTAGSMLLTRLLTPKPKPNELGRMQGSIQISDSTWDVVKPELYGGPLADGIGGSLIGVNVIWLNKEGIREHRTTVPASSGGGGKGPPKPPPDVKISYDCDIACLVGEGPLEVLRIKFNDDIAYSVMTAGPGNENRQYEAENLALNTYSAGAAIALSALCSGGKKVNLPLNDWVQFGGVQASTSTDFDLTVYYINSADTSIELRVNGGSPQTEPLANSNGVIATVSFSISMPVSTTNTIKITNLSAATTAIDRIALIVIPPFDPGDGPDDPYRRGRFAGVTGQLDDLYPRQQSYDPFLLPDPYIRDVNPLLRHSAIAPAAAADGSITARTAAGLYGELLIYEGNDDQEPDPVISADIDNQFPTELAAGRKSTPAYLGDCYFRISGLNISKYNGFPNITVVARNKVTHTVADILVLRAKRVGLLDADLDMSVTAATESRGYVITQQESPKETMEAFAQRYNFDFVETTDGIVLAVDLTDRTIVDTIAENELHATVKGGGGGDNDAGDLVITSVPDESDMWKYVKIGFFNPLMEWQPDSRQDLYPFTTSIQTESRTWNMTMLPDEAYEVARRILQMHWAAANPDQFILPDSRLWLFPSNRILLPIAGQLRARRIMEMQGTFPGVFKCSGVPDELTVFAGAGLTPTASFRPVQVSANTVATFLDIPLLHPEAVPGVYISATALDETSGAWPGATAFRFKNDTFQQMTTFVAPCTMGRAHGVLGDVPAGWADARNNFIRAFYGGTAAGGTHGTGALNREPDVTFELKKWSDKLREIDPFLVGQQLGHALFLSPEYIARARTNTEFVTDLYSAFYDRDPDAGGLAFFVGQLAGTTIARTNLVGGTESGSPSIFTKTAATGWGNSGFTSIGSIVGDGFIEWTATEDDKGRMIGLSTDVPRTNLVSYWKLNETSGTRVDSVGTNDLTDNNTVTSVGGIIDNAAQFTAANSESLSHADNADLSTGDIDFSFSAWVFLDDKSADRMIIGKDINTSGNREYFLTYDSFSDRFHFQVHKATDVGASVAANTLGSPSVGAWYFIVAWHDAAADTVNIRVNNGTADSAATGGALQASGSAPFRLGARDYAGFLGYMNGRIDEVGFWKRVLTAAEQTALFNAGHGKTLANADPHYLTIEYAWFLRSDGVYDVYESGSSATADAGYGSYVAATTVFKIERIGTTLTYYKDGSSTRVVTGVTTDPLFVDAAFKENGATIGPIDLSPGVGSFTRVEVLDAFGVSPEFEDRCAVSGAEFFDTTNSISVDLFHGELTSVTDSEARAGLNAIVIGDEVCVAAIWTRDMAAPNRWTGTRLLRRLKGTDAASATHVTEERFVLMNSAVRFVQLDDTESGVQRIWKIVTSGQRIEDAAEISVTWNGASIVDPTVEPHVPTLGAAATITKDDAGANWIIYTPKPGLYGVTITDVQLFQYSDAAGTLLVRGNIPGSNSGRTLLAQSAADAYFRYRWRNQSNEDIGNGRGWSNLSDVSAVAYGTGSGTPNPDDGGIDPPDIDPFDGGDRGGCFVPGTFLRVPGGETRGIEWFEVGDPIMCMDFTLGQLVETVVTETEVHDDMRTNRLVTESGRLCRSTDEQPLHIGDTRFARADAVLFEPRNLSVWSDAIAGLADDRVVSREAPMRSRVHHLHVAHPDHNYVLENGIIAHNIKPRIVI